LDKKEDRMREFFHLKIKELEEDLVEMGNMVINAIQKAILALKELNMEEAQKIIEGDRKIDEKRWKMEEKCVNLIATQQPVATELREFIAILSIITDLERMGDHAEGIAKIILMHGKKPLVKPLIDIPRMAEKAVDMLRRSLEAFLRRDVESARKIHAEDDEIDMLYEQIYRELLSYMIEDPRTITRATYLLWVAHNLERIGDRITNICERIVYLVKGRIEEETQ